MVPNVFWCALFQRTNQVVLRTSASPLCYQTFSVHKTENGRTYSSDHFRKMTAHHKNVIENDALSGVETEQNTEITPFTQEQVNSQIRAHFAPISWQLADLTKLIKALNSKMTGQSDRASYSRASTSTAGTSQDTPFPNFVFSLGNAKWRKDHFIQRNAFKDENHSLWNVGINLFSSKVFEWKLGCALLSRKVSLPSF